MTERQLRNSCVAYAKKYGLLHKRMHFGAGAAGGWPDDLFVTERGDHIWIEFKRPGKTATPLQDAVHTRMRKHNCVVRVIDDYEKFRALIMSVTATA